MNDQQAIAELCTIYETVKFSEVEANCLMALGQICDTASLERIFKYAIVDDKVRAQDLIVP